jgi:hypothetical protein
MKRIHIVGLCLVAGIAFSAMVTASASAAPEFGQCKLLTKSTQPKAKKGVYANPSCTEPYSKKGKVEAKGNYEWYPGAPAACVYDKKAGKYSDPGCTDEVSKKGNYNREPCYPNCAELTGTGGKAFLEGESSHLKIECDTNGSKGGEVLSATEATAIGYYTGCHIEAFGVSCKSGTEAGVIETYKLEAYPREISGKVWIEYTNKSGAHSPYLAEFNCEVATLRVKGSADALDTGNVNAMSVTSTQEFSNALGNQALITEKNTGSGFGEPEGSKQNQTTSVTSNDPEGGEIRT